MSPQAPSPSSQIPSAEDTLTQALVSRSYLPDTHHHITFIFDFLSVPSGGKLHRTQFFGIVSILYVCNHLEWQDLFSRIRSSDPYLLKEWFKLDTIYQNQSGNLLQSYSVHMK